MAIVRIIRPEGTTAEMYDAVGKKLNIGDDPLSRTLGLASLLAPTPVKR